MTTTDETGRRVRGPLKRTGRGVYWREERGCWAARITVTRNGREKNIHLGHYDKEADALKARAKAEANLKKDPYFYTPDWLNVVLLILLLLVANGRAASYSTSFPGTQSPLGSPWINGQAVGGSWKNCNSVPGMAYGTQTGGGGYDDSTAVLSGSWASDQTAQATVVVRQGTSSIAEVELRLRTSITSGRLTGYEFNYSVANGRAYCQIVRWNGSLGSFTILSGVARQAHSGDIIKATAIGNTLTMYLNGAPIASKSDSTFKGGSPGIGFYVTTSGINQNFGLTNFSASDTGSPVPPPSGVTWNVWEQSLLSQMQAVGVPSGQRNAINNWLASHPPIPDP